MCVLNVAICLGCLCVGVLVLVFVGIIDCIGDFYSMFGVWKTGFGGLEA